MQRKVQVQRKMRPAIVAERAPDRVELVLLRDAEDELAAVLRLVREFVKAQGKCLLEELWETRGEFVIFRDDALAYSSTPQPSATAQQLRLIGTLQSSAFTS